MASLDMSLDNMVQNNRRNGARCGGQVRGMRCVRCPGGQARGVSCPAGQRRGLRGVSCPAGKQRGMRGVRGPGGPIRGVVRSVVRQHRGPLGIHSIVKGVRRTRNFPCQDSVLRNRLKVGGASGIESGTKLQVSNLNAGVSNEDIRKPFSEIGELVRCGIHYDKNGTPCGSAEVVFARRGDAFQAVKRYNNAQLDGNPMKIENVRSVARSHVASRRNIVGGTSAMRTDHMTSGTGYMRKRPGPGYMRNAAILNPDVGPSRQRARGGWSAGVPIRGRGGRGGGRRHSGLRGRMVEKSVEELDKELEIYQAETTQTV